MSIGGGDVDIGAVYSTTKVNGTLAIGDIDNVESAIHKKVDNVIAISGESRTLHGVIVRRKQRWNS